MFVSFIFFPRTQFCRAFRCVPLLLTQNLSEVDGNLNMCSKLIICLKTLLSREEFMPMMKSSAELVLMLCLPYFLSPRL